ncbi:hypothetical protein [Thermocrinis sp.]
MAKSALEGGVGSPHRLEKSLEEKNIAYSIGHSANFSKRIKEGEVPEGYGYENVGMLRIPLYLAFEHLPKRLAFVEPQDYYSLLNPKACKPILSDFPVLLSTPLGDFPSYTFILGKRWNLAYPDCENMEIFIPVVDGDLSLAIYSPPNFYTPSRDPLQRAILSLHTDKKRVLIIIHKDSKLWGVYDQPMLTLDLKEIGTYEVKVYRYEMKVLNIYFGLRFLSCIPEIKVQAK